MSLFGLNPAHDSRIELIIAGDVEQNPGPISLCCMCGKKLGSRGKLACYYAECDRVCHKQEGCSGYNKLHIPTEWLCPEHEPNPHQQDDVSYCEVCSTPIVKVNSTIPLSCAYKQCKKACHQNKCSNIRRRTKDPVWLCPLHLDKESDLLEEEQE